ncbi:replication initiator protein A [Deinococcus cellulosilyticus]|uniref:Replication initiator protein A n=1 Tax=Deinococcus cellulosilyticus (strain DSM 18568 / NBRC 106333 / KACC 11606 / 5516J-15) TaxID=1223518 RepID=A0A511N0L8_DEIC1|nr:replication initiator protein A [Deinococcus cellulosilyticus]GEM46403.1 hypothetical protein DC3_20380 [Deinococcus cellulosilyticus NBRC 106333 = KACC 11606]
MTRDENASKDKHSPDELNISRLGLISAQRQVADDFKNWDMDFELDGQPMKVTCESPTTVPHGVDTEIYLSLIKRFIDEGAPDDGRFTVTPRELLMASGIEPNSRAYQMLKVSLNRLYKASYTIERAWRDHLGKRWVTVHFRHLDALTYTKNEDHHLDSASVIQVGLPKQIVHSIHSGYLNPLNSRILDQLSQPTSKALYRQLEAKRRDPETLEIIHYRLDFSLVEWGVLCHLSDLTPTKIRRSLQSAHDELKSVGYLKDIAFQGRGQQQRIIYEFPQGQQDALEATTLLSELVARGMTQGFARTAIQQYPGRIQQAIERFDQLKQMGYQMSRPGALLMNIIKNPENYASDDLPMPTKPSRGRKTTEKASKARAETRQPEAEPTLPPSPEQQLKTLTLLLKNDLSVPEKDLLNRAIENQLLNLEDLLQRLMTAMYENKKPDFVNDLRITLMTTG